MGISSEYLPEIEEAVENEDPKDGGSETESIQQEQNVVSDTEETLAQGDSETEISENKQSGNFSENDKKTAEIFSEEEQQSGEAGFGAAVGVGFAGAAVGAGFAGAAFFWILTLQTKRIPFT